MKNQCDGCVSGEPIEGGIHLNHDGVPHLYCTADEYLEDWDCDIICTTCSGSGEGFVYGTNCFKCKGSGIDNNA